MFTCSVGNTLAPDIAKMPRQPRTALDVHRPPPAALRFAYAGAAAHESAVLHGLAAAYEGLFRLEPDFPVHGRAAYRHAQKPDKWIAFNGSGWMAQHEGALGSQTGVLLLCDASCATPDLSAAIWKVTTHGRLPSRPHPHLRPRPRPRQSSSSLVSSLPPADAHRAAPTLAPPSPVAR